MKKYSLLIILVLIIIPLYSQKSKKYNIKVITELKISEKIGQLRAVPVNLGGDQPKAICAMYSEDAEIDPYIGMFFFPKNTLKLIMFDEKGNVLWKRDLGEGVVPGIWFSPIFSFDHDNNGKDEIWIINNKDSEHPLNYRGYHLERLDAKTGQTTGQWKWKNPESNQSMSHTYRHFIMGGYVNGEPILLTAQGTYGSMSIQAWNSDMSLRWEHNIAKDAKGCLGSHVTPIIDINSDGIDELLWGERCIELDKGKQLFCADENSWEGHSDIIQPTLDKENNKWYFHVCRESYQEQSPRIIFYDSKGNKVWGDLDKGHIDTGWSARLGKKGETVVLGVRVGEKIRTAEGEKRMNVEEFIYDAFTGVPIDLGFKVYTSIPVDLNGDGIHELVKGYFEGDGNILNNEGNIIGNIDGLSAMASKFTSLPGEQILSYSKNGYVRIWADINAKDNKAAKFRYNHPYYKINQKQTGNGYNLFSLGGI